MMKMTVAAVGLTALALGAQAQVVTYTENFTGVTTQNSWFFSHGACLTAGNSTSLVSPGLVPSCATLRLPGNYYNVFVAGNPNFDTTAQPLVGGNTGTLPDNPALGGALRFTNAPTVGGFPNGLFENGGILSNFSFPLSTQGLQVTFTTETYDPGYGPGFNPAYDGADGLSFFLQDASQFADIGAAGGSLAYSCSNQNPDPNVRSTGPGTVLGHQRGYDGIVGGYIGLGIDEYGNFLNGAIDITGGGAVVEQAATYPGIPLGPNGWDNASTGYGWVPNRIGLRGAGSTSFHYLTTTWPAYYPAGAPNNLTDAQRNAAVQQACTTGFAWNWSGITSATAAVANKTTANPLYPTQNIPNVYGAVPISGTKIPFNYAPIPGAYKVLSGVQIANEAALYRGTVTPVAIPSQYGVPITYNLKITTAGLLSLSYSFNGGAFQNVLTNKDITVSNGTLPAQVRFGFAGSEGGVPNTHEVMCFKATPTLASQSSAGINQKESAPVLTGTSQVYFSYYDPTTWAGGVTAQNLIINASGDVAINAVANWDASCVLTGVVTGESCAKTGVLGPTAAQGVTSPSRTILSWNGTVGIPFEWANLTAAQKAALDTGDASQTALRLNYLRGDRTNELTPAGAGLYRDRVSVLGDIIDSSPTWVGPPNASYPATWKDAFAGGPLPENSGQSYAAFITAAQTRTNVVYTGANDGMLHGFRTGSFDASNNYVKTNNDGLEVLAYVPGYIVNTINAGATTADDYSNPQYGHHFDVDAAPGTGDVFYGGTWHTWLVGGLGPGGSALYALDITNPANFSENSPTATVIGEWSNASMTCTHVTTNATTSAATCGQNLGNTFGVPQIRRFHNGQWGAVFGNGFGSTSGDAGIYVMLVNSSGIPSFYYLSAGKSGKSDGIAYATAADLDGDHTVDYVYAGDLLGNVWRFDLTSIDPTAWAVKTAPLFTTGAGQPITSKLAVVSIVTNPLPHVLVEFGTGQQVPVSNTAGASYSNSKQYLYGVWDWDLTTWNATSATDFASLSSSPGTLTSTNLQLQTISYVTSGGVDYSSVSNTAICFADKSGCSQYGWYVALSTGHVNPPPGDVNLLSAAASANPIVYEQVIYSPVILAGAFVVNTTIPPTSSVATCNSTNAGGWTYAIDPATGGAFKKSFFGTNHTFTTVGGLVVSGEALSGTGSPSMVTYNGQSYLVTQNVTGSGTVVEANPPAGTVGSRLTWLEKR